MTTVTSVNTNPDSMISSFTKDLEDKRVALTSARQTIVEQIEIQRIGLGTTDPQLHINLGKVMAALKALNKAIGDGEAKRGRGRPSSAAPYGKDENGVALAPYGLTADGAVALKRGRPTGWRKNPDAPAAVKAAPKDPGLKKDGTPAKKRGRPAGSKNKPKTQSPIIAEVVVPTPTPTVVATETPAAVTPEQSLDQVLGA